VDWKYENKIVERSHNMNKIHASALFLLTTAAMYATGDESSANPQHARTIKNNAEQSEGRLRDIAIALTNNGYSETIKRMFKRYINGLKQSGEEEKATTLETNFDLFYLSDNSKTFPIQRNDLATYIGSGFKTLKINESSQYQAAYIPIIMKNPYINKLFFLNGISSDLNLIELLDGKSMDVLAINVDKYALRNNPGYDIKPLLDDLLESKLSLKKLILYAKNPLGEDEKALLTLLQKKTQIHISIYVDKKGEDSFEAFYKEAEHDAIQ
jgi:hypothetical protein